MSKVSVRVASLWAHRSILSGLSAPMETVLIIEDSRPMQRTLKRLFEADSLGVRIASDGEEGLESFREDPPNVVVLDLKLPGLSGKELCRSFKMEMPSVPEA